MLNYSCTGCYDLCSRCKGYPELIIDTDDKYAIECPNCPNSFSKKCQTIYEALINWNIAQRRSSKSV